MRKCFGLLVFLIFVLLAIPCEATPPKRGPSTPEERARAIRVAHLLQSDPLARNLKKDREWLIRWLIDVPDISVSLCPSLLGDLGDDSDYRAAITAAMIGAQAAFVIQHPDQPKDSEATYLAGVEGALNGYQTIQRQHPEYKIGSLEALLRNRVDGGLPDAVRNAAKSCKPKT